MSSATSNACARCHAGLRPADVRCPACGTPRPGVELPPASLAVQATSESISRGLIDNPYAVLAAVFLAMAVLGIPLIWACRAWSPATKTVLTVITLIYTAVIFWLFWLVMVWSWSRIGPALQ